MAHLWCGSLPVITITLSFPHRPELLNPETKNHMDRGKVRSMGWGPGLLEQLQKTTVYQPVGYTTRLSYDHPSNSRRMLYKILVRWHCSVMRSTHTCLDEWETETRSSCACPNSNIDRHSISVIFNNWMTGKQTSRVRSGS